MKLRKGQSILEYAVLLAVIIAALAVMQTYIKRAYQGRLKREADNLGQQYSPGHTVTLNATVTESDSVTYSGGKTDPDDSDLIDGEVEVPDGVSVTFTKTSTRTERREGIDSYATEFDDEDDD
ncbi:MAG: hypothetical protein GY858_06085 [Candidatus Omnitrophica bacterium]|nr:hypothetical protein [Candidatus Omnitrophota bacterium]